VSLPDEVLREQPLTCPNLWHRDHPTEVMPRMSFRLQIDLERYPRHVAPASKEKQDVLVVPLAKRAR